MAEFAWLLIAAVLGAWVLTAASAWLADYDRTREGRRQARDAANLGRQLAALDHANQRYWDEWARSAGDSPIHDQLAVERMRAELADDVAVRRLLSPRRPGGAA
jgi:biopolymer transport protein ExbB/TolQ